MVHVIGSSLVLAQPPGLVALLGAAGIGTACWLLGPLAAALTLRGQLLGPALFGSVGFLTALLSLSDTLAFSSAVIAFGGPFDLDRLATVITFGGGLGLFLVAIAAFRRVDTPTTPPTHGTGEAIPDTAPTPAAWQQAPRLWGPMPPDAGFRCGARLTPSTPTGGTDTDGGGS